MDLLAGRQGSIPGPERTRFDLEELPARLLVGPGLHQLLEYRSHELLKD